MEVVGPLGVEAPAARVHGRHGARVVQVALGDQHGRHAGRGAHPLAQLRQHVAGARVVDRVDRVHPEAVDVKVADPHLGVLDRPLAHAPAVGVVEVHGPAPGRAVAVGEVGPERLERLRPGPDVVVDDVQDHPEPGGVGGVDERGKARGAAVHGVRGPRVEPVVAPVAVAGEGGHGHQLDGGDAQLAQRRQALRGRRERPPGGERADMELVDDQVVRVEAAPAAVGPRPRAGVDHLRRTAHALRLEAGARVGERVAAVQDVAVAVAGGGAHPCREGPELLVEHLPAPVQLHLHLRRVRRPHAEHRRAVTLRCGAERRLPWQAGPALTHPATARSLPVGAASARRRRTRRPRGAPRRARRRGFPDSPRRRPPRRCS